MTARKLTLGGLTLLFVGILALLVVLEMPQVAAVDRFARENPDDPDLDEIRDGVIRGKDVDLRWGRREMGYATLVLRTPGGER
jgi:hypothetical protein